MHNNHRNLALVGMVLGLLVVPIVFGATFRYTQPYVGPWDYGENRCVTTKWGYPDAQAAMEGGLDRHYNFGCEQHIVSVGQWGRQKVRVEVLVVDTAGRIIDMDSKI